MEKKYKIFLISDMEVGKTNILSIYIKNSFLSNSRAAVGVDYIFKSINNNEGDIKLELWDTSGQERFRLIILPYCEGASGLFIVYDIINKESYNNIDKWINLIKQYINNKNIRKNPIIILLGNKLDLLDERQVSVEDITEKAQQYRIAFFERSALNNLSFNRLVEKNITKRTKRENKGRRTNNR